MVEREGARDEPLTGGASRQRLDEQPNHSRQALGDDEDAIACESEIKIIRQLFGARIEIARRTVPKAERAGFIRALKREKKAAVAEVTDRMRKKTAERRKAAKLQRPSPSDPQPSD